MVLRVLELVLLLVVARSFWSLVGGVMEGLGGVRGSATPQNRAPDQAVAMMRDPVCGTFVLPDRAVSITDASGRVYFCSTTCRDKYRAGHSASPRSQRAPGRTA
jgi:YHS domain-containing protein